MAVAPDCSIVQPTVLVLRKSRIQRHEPLLGGVLLIAQSSQTQRSLHVQVILLEPAFMARTSRVSARQGSGVLEFESGSVRYGPVRSDNGTMAQR